MPFVPTSIPTGVGLHWDSHIQPNLDDARDWLNDIPDADVSGSGIRREHLLRPAAAGYPLNGQQGMLSGYADPLFIGSGSPWRRTEFGALPDRELVAPKFVDAVNGLWWCRVGKTLHIPKWSYVNVTCTFDMHVRADTSAPVLYPNGAGGPAGAALGGFFSIHEYSVPDGTDAEIAHSRRYVYPLDYNTLITLGSYQDDVFLFANRQVTGAKAGEYTYQLVYHADTIPSELDQIDLTNIQFLVEVL